MRSVLVTFFGLFPSAYYEECEVSSQASANSINGTITYSIYYLNVNDPGVLVSRAGNIPGVCR